MIPVRIQDSDGSGIGANVTDEGNLNVIIAPKPPENGATLLPVKREFKTAAGASDMRVNGAVTPVDFFVQADVDFDIYIKSISILIADAAATLGQFGSLTALTNGVRFEWITNDLGTQVIEEGMKSNFDFVRLATGQPAFGDGISAFRAGNVVGNADAFIPFVDINQVFGMQWGLKLRKGTRDRLVFTVQDDTRPVDAFQITAYGAKI